MRGSSSLEELCANNTLKIGFLDEYIRPIISMREYVIHHADFYNAKLDYTIENYRYIKLRLLQALF